MQWSYSTIHTFQTRLCNPRLECYMPLDEMRLNHVLCSEFSLTPITPESLSTPITQCQSLCLIKSIIFGFHPMIILQNKFIVFKPKAFWMLHLNDHSYSKPRVYLSVANFRVSPQASQYQKNSSYDGASICPHKMAGPFEMPILDRRKKNWLLGRGLVRKSSSME